MLLFCGCFLLPTLQWSQIAAVICIKGELLLTVNQFKYLRVESI